MVARTVEDLVRDQMAACLAATEDCLALSRTVRDDDKYGHARQADLDYVAKLLKANARLIEALASLRGDSSHTIYVRKNAAEG